MLECIVSFIGSVSVQQSQSSLLTALIPLAVIIVIMYFLIFRPQMKRNRLRVTMLSSIKKGDRVILYSSGIVGTVVEVKDNDIIVVESASTIIEVMKTAITGVLSEEQERE